MSKQNGSDVDNDYQEIFQDAIGAETEKGEDLIQTEGESSKKTEKEEKVVEEKGNKIKLDTEVSEEETDNPLDSSTITAEMAKEFGFDKNLIGKPLREGFNSYKNLQKYDTKLSQELAEIRRTMGEFQKELSQKEVKQVEEEVEDQLPDYDTELAKYQEQIDNCFDDDGFLTDKKEYNKAMAAKDKFIKEFNDKRYERLEKAMDKKLEEKNAPTSSAVNEIQEERYKAAVYDEIVDSLSAIYEGEIPSKMVQKVLDDYGELISQEDEETQKLYFKLYNNPAKLAKDAVNYHKVSMNPKQSREDAEKKAQEAHNKQKENLKKKEKSFVQSAASGRDVEKDVKKEDEDYVDLMNESMDSYENAERFGSKGKE